MDFGPQLSEYAGKTVGVYGGKFFPFHRGHLSFILRAQSLVDVLFVAVQYDEEHERRLLEGTSFELVPASVRERWIAETLREFPNIRVVTNYERRSPEHMTDDTLFESYARLRAAVGGHIDVLFSGSHDNDAYVARYVPEAEHVVFYEDRDVFPISATEIRRDGVYARWEMLPDAVKRHYQKRVAVVGIESSGKTHLSRMLALHLGTVAVPEFGRLFYERIGGFTGIDTPLDYADIVSGHIAALNDAARVSVAPVLVSDTDIVYTQFFYESSFGERSPVLDAMIRANADRIDLRVFIEPYESHVLDGTRLAVSADARASKRERLLGLYQHYGIDVVFVDEPERVARFDTLRAVVDSVVDGVPPGAR